MEDWDVIVAGAGAAGLTAAIASAERGARTLALDSQKTIGAKILVAGGGRCNVTNEFVHPSRFNSGSQRFVERVLRAFSVEDTHRFFERIGVPLKLEETGKYFPVADSGKAVLKALLETLGAAGGRVQTGERVSSIRPDGSAWRVTAAEKAYQAQSVVVCSGGLALPKSGSNGAGYAWARALGHEIVPTTPALSPLLADPAAHAHLSGVTMPVRLQLCAENKTLAGCEGSFLFTHTGYSGPAALNLCRHVVRGRWEHPEAQVYARFLPEVQDGEEQAFWRDLMRRHARKSAAGALSRFIPRRLAETIASEAKARQTPLGKLSKDVLLALQGLTLNHRLPVSGVAGYRFAEATAGGVALDDVEGATMQSRLRPGLFFAGEILDVDGWLGGYNFQWAWSSGAVAGRTAARMAMRARGQ